MNYKFALKHFELAEMYMVYNRYDDALFEYNKVIALDTENLDARVKVAKVYAKKDDNEVELKKLADLDKYSSGYTYHLKEAFGSDIGVPTAVDKWEEADEETVDELRLCC